MAAIDVEPQSVRKEVAREMDAPRADQFAALDAEGDPKTGLTARLPKLAFVVAVDWYFCLHWLPLARAVRCAGYDVCVITVVTDAALARRIEGEGFRLLPLRLSRGGLNPFAEWRSMRVLVTHLRAERPDLVHGIAQKPVLYAALAARLAGVHGCVGTLAGMGYLFTSPSYRVRILRVLVVFAYGMLLRGRRVRIIVQNPDDRGQLRRSVGIDPALIKGAGVDLSRFQPTSPPPDPVTIVLASRMLWDKGVQEFVDAARSLQETAANLRFVLVGKPDPGNPAAVPESRLRSWQADGIIEWWGHRDDMPAVLQQAHIVCLPSYREGLPTILIEAAAAGLPLVATDVPGCREVVRDGENGLLVPARDAGALADALARLAEDVQLRERFGRRSRDVAEAEFGIERVAEETLAVYRALLTDVGRAEAV